MTTLTVGAGQQFSTISDAVNAAQAGDTIQVQAGTYTDDFPNYIGNLTIEGVGGQVNLVATYEPPNGKAIFDVGGNTTLKNLTFSGAADDDGNGAGVRYEYGNLTIENCVFDNNQDGVLSNPDPNGTITIDSSEFYDNGTPAGNAHNMYIGNIKQFTIKNSYIHDANTGHEIKTRAMNNDIENNRIFDNGSNSSYSIDVCDGGVTEVKGNVIEQGANGGNPNIIAFGEEGSSGTVSGTPNPGNALDLTDNVIINDMTAHSPGLVWNASGATVTGSGNELYGINSGQLGSGVLASAFASLANEPVLNTSSPLTSSSAASAAPPAIQGGSFGSGNDTLTVTLAEDAYQGDAQANVSIDGKLLTSSPITVTALYGSNQSETFSFLGNFGSGQHSVGVSFLNDAYGGSSSLDRNLYVQGVSLNGQASPDLAGGTVEEYITGTDTFGVSGGTDPSSSSSQGTIVVNASASEANGAGAHFKLIVDGTKIGSATVSDSTAQPFSFNANLAPGQAHDIQVQYDNDLRVGTADRNLFLKSITVGGQDISATSSLEVYHATGGPGDIPSSGNMYWNGTAEFSLPANVLAHS